MIKEKWEAPSPSAPIFPELSMTSNALRQERPPQRAKKQPANLSLTKIVLIVAGFAMALVIALWAWVDHRQTDIAEEAYAAAKDAMADENYPKALAELDMAIAHKDKAAYFHTKFKILNDQNRDYEAALNIEKAIDRDPANASYFYEAGRCHLGINSEKALPYLEKAVALDPKNSEYRMVYGNSLAQNNRFREGLTILKKLAQDDPNYYDVWNDLVTLYEYTNQPDKAVQTGLMAVKKFPDDASLWFLLGNTYDHQKKIAEAVRAYQKSIHLEPEGGTFAAYRIATLTRRPVQEKYRQIVEDGIPVTYRGPHAYIHARVAGHSGLFLLDTGATDSIVYSHFLDRNGWKIGSNAPRAQYETASGMVSAPVIYSAMKIGRFQLGNVRLAVLSSPTGGKETDGIIGMNVMKDFDVRMDNLRETLLFSRK